MSIDSITDILKPPSQLLEQELRGIFSFNMMHHPGEIFTDDEPPIQLDDYKEILPIDEFLGTYSPDTQKIVIYNKGIQEASILLQINNKHLEIIVRLHEYAHAILHLGVSKEDNLKILRDDSFWGVLLSDSCILFSEIEPSLHEYLAQMLSFYCIQNLKQDAKTDQGRQAIEKMEHAFHKLSSRQPLEYRIQDLLDVPKSRVHKSISLLRNRLLPGKAETWKTIVTW